MKKILALILALTLVAALCACGGNSEPAPTEEPAPVADEPVAEPEEPVEEPVNDDASGEPSAEPAGEVTWADYQEYLIAGAGANSPDPDAFAEEVYALNGWDDIDLEAAPWNLMFTTIGMSTWEEFQQGIVKEALVAGGPDATGEMSGEPTGEIAEDGEEVPVDDAD